MEDTRAVVDDEHRRRLEVTVDGDRAALVYRIAEDRLVLVHTEVPGALEGRGLGSALVRAAIAKALAEGRTIEPRCPFARGWLERHPDEAARVAIDWPAV